MRELLPSRGTARGDRDRALGGDPSPVSDVLEDGERDATSSCLVDTAAAADPLGAPELCLFFANGATPVPHAPLVVETTLGPCRVAVRFLGGLSFGTRLEGMVSTPTAEPLRVGVSGRV